MIEWGCFQYTVMPFGLKNALKIFSRVVIVMFKEFIHKFLEVYFYDLTIFGLVKCHVASLRLILDTCRRYHITLNLKKCFFYVPFGILLGHVVCKKGLMVDLCQDHGDSKFGGLEDCQTVVCNARTYKILQKIHQGLCSDYYTYGETIEEGCYIMLGWRMSAQCGCIEREVGHHANIGLPRLEEGITCARWCLVYCIGSSADKIGWRRDGSPYSLCEQKIIEG